MTDFYTQRLDGYRQTKEEKAQKIGLPSQRPNLPSEGGEANPNVMASKPKDSNSSPEGQIPDGLFKSAFESYTKDPNFSAGMEEYVVSLKAMNQEMDGLGLPESVRERRVKQLLEKFQGGYLAKEQEQLQMQQLMQSSSQMGVPSQQLQSVTPPQNLGGANGF